MTTVSKERENTSIKNKQIPYT